MPCSLSLIPKLQGHYNIKHQSSMLFQKQHKYMKNKSCNKEKNMWLKSSISLLSQKHALSLTHTQTHTESSLRAPCQWAQHLPLWLRGIMRRYEWQCVFYCPHSCPPSCLSRSLTVSFRWQRTLLIPQCSGINADDMQSFEGCVVVRFKCLLSSGSWSGQQTLCTAALSRLCCEEAHWHSHFCV